MDGDDLEDYSNRLFNAWGIGKVTSNNGVLVLNSVGDKKLRIEVGYGMEAYLTDAKSKRIIEGMIPFMKNNDKYGAFNYAIHEIEKIINLAKEDEKATTTSNTTQSSSNVYQPNYQKPSEPINWTGVFNFFFALFVIGLFAYLIYAIIKGTKEFNTDITDKTDNIKKLKSQYDTSVQRFLRLIESTNTDLKLHLVESTNTDLKSLTLIEDIDVDSFYKTLNKLSYSIFSNKSKDKAVLFYEDMKEKLSLAIFNINTKYNKLNIAIELEKKRIELIENEKNLIDDANHLLSKYDLNTCDKYYKSNKVEFEQEFEFIKFCSIPNFELLINTLNKAIKKLDGKGTYNNELTTAIKSFEAAINNISSFTNNKLRDRKYSKDFLQKVTELYTNIKSEFYSSATRLRTGMLEYCTVTLLQVNDLFKNEKYEDVNELCTKISKSVSNIKEDFDTEIKYNNKLSGINNLADKVNKTLYLGDSKRRQYNDNGLNAIKQAKKAFDDQNYILALQSLLNAEKEFNNVIRDYEDELERERQRLLAIERERQRKIEEEERRLRRLREEREAEERRQRDSYNSSSYSSSSSSSYDSGGSSFGGGSSGGGGASGDY